MWVSDVYKCNNSTSSPVAVSCGKLLPAPSERWEAQAYGSARMMSAQTFPVTDITYFILHAKLALTLRCTAELIRVAEHVVQSDFCYAHELFIANLAVNDSTPPLIQSPNDSA